MIPSKWQVIRLPAIVTYGVNDTGTLLHREPRYPPLRTLPKDTYATLGCHHEQIQSFSIDGKTIQEYPERFVFDGLSMFIPRMQTIR